jgi:hypothetical protein
MYLLSEEHVGTVTAAAETAIRRGCDLLRWWNTAQPVLSPIRHSFPGVTMHAFFEAIPVEGVMKPGMGCLQTSTFRRGRAAEGRPPVDLRTWIMESAVRECYRPGGGGFLYQPLLARRAGPDGAVERLPQGPAVRLADLGRDFEWVVQRLDLPDYALALPFPRGITRLMRPFLRESGSVVFSRTLYDSPHVPMAGAREQATFGYAVVPWRIDPTILGFGPGRFHAALKQYRVCLLEDNSVTIEVVFIVCPRTQKILDIGGLDPVYGTVRALDALTFHRTRIVEKAHAGIDRYAMAHHGRVHINMLEGMRDIWEGTNWTAGPAGTVWDSAAAAHSETRK